MTAPTPARLDACRIAPWTPGPWHVTGTINRRAGEANLHIGAASSLMVLASMNEVHTDTEANAALIAAAPALYEELDRLCKALNARGYTTSLADTILALARGESA